MLIEVKIDDSFGVSGSGWVRLRGGLCIKSEHKLPCLDSNRKYLGSWAA